MIRRTLVVLSFFSGLWIAAGIAVYIWAGKPGIDEFLDWTEGRGKYR